MARMDAEFVWKKDWKSTRRVVVIREKCLIREKKYIVLATTT